MRTWRSLGRANAIRNELDHVELLLDAALNSKGQEKDGSRLDKDTNQLHFCSLKRQGIKKEDRSDSAEREQMVCTKDRV